MKFDLSYIFQHIEVPVLFSSGEWKAEALTIVVVILLVIILPHNTYDKGKVYTTTDSTDICFQIIKTTAANLERYICLYVHFT